MVSLLLRRSCIVVNYCKVGIAWNRIEGTSNCEILIYKGNLGTIDHTESDLANYLMVERRFNFFSAADFHFKLAPIFLLDDMSYLSLSIQCMRV